MILGITASHGLGVRAGSDMELISTTLLTGNQSSVTFSSLDTYSTTYRHLQVRFTMRPSTTDCTLMARFNGTQTRWDGHFLLGDGGSVTSGRRASDDLGLVYVQDFASTTSSAFATGIIDILDAYSTNKYKTIRMHYGQEGTSGRVALTSSAFASTNATTSFALSVGTGSVAPWQGINFTSGSRFSIYGIKG